MNWTMKMYNTKINNLLLGLLLFAAVGCNESPQSTSEKSSRTEVLPYYQEATFTPHWLQTGDAALADFHRIPPFELVNQNGKRLTEHDFAGKIYVADFFFTTCPGICRKMTLNMTLLQDAFEDDPDVLLLSHSVTPDRDSVEVLRDFATNHEAMDDKWHMVTGQREHIYDLGRNHYFVEEDLGLEKDVDEFLHTENFVLIDGNRHIRGIYNGLNKTAIAQLIADIKTLKLEAPTNS